MLGRTLPILLTLISLQSKSFAQPSKKSPSPFSLDLSAPDNATTPLSLETAMLDAAGNIIGEPAEGSPLALRKMLEKAEPIMLKYHNEFLDKVRLVPTLSLAAQLDSIQEFTAHAKETSHSIDNSKATMAIFDESIGLLQEHCDSLLNKATLNDDNKEIIRHALYDIATYYSNTGKRLSAEIVLKKVLPLDVALYGEDSLETAESYRLLAITHRALGHTTEEIEYLTKAYLIFNIKKPDSLELAQVLLNLSEAEFDQYGDTARRAKPLRRAAKIIDALPPSPKMTMLAMHLAQALLDAKEDPEYVVQFYKKSVDAPLASQLIDLSTPLDDIFLRLITATFHPDPKEKRLKLESLLAGVEKHYGNQPYQALPIINALAEAAELKEEKAMWYLRAISIRQKAFGKDHISVAITYGKLCNYGNNTAEMIKWANEALRLFALNKASNHVESASAHSIAGFSYMLTDKPKALSMMLKAIELVKNNKVNDFTFIIDSLEKVATLHYGLGQPQQAFKAIEEALILATEKLGKDHPKTIHAKQGYDIIKKEALTFGASALKAEKPKKNTTYTAAM
ncbi:MAG: tetratricopeptide repeat protein [Gammaproteobacteria bacterium]|nr:tetratricopeptide repeat protein [Gammaproteobacteria bacterium]